MIIDPLPPENQHVVRKLYNPYKQNLVYNTVTIIITFLNTLNT